MPNRQDVVKSAISISALPLMGGAFVSRTDGLIGSGLRDVLVDERNSASRAFGGMAEARGLNVQSSRGDWSRLWLTRLDHEWRAEPAPIAGVTHHGALVHLRATRARTLTLRWPALIVVVMAAALGRDIAAQAPGKEFRDCEQCPAMIVLRGGVFMMGDDSAQARPDERPVHEVRVAAFAIGKTEITRAEYAAFAKATVRDAPGYCTTDADHDGRWENTATATWIEPGFPVTDAHPVTCVNWADATAYVAWLAATTGQPYRLVTEAEWEYAARAGSTTQYWWGDDANAMCTHANGPDATAQRQFPRWRAGATCDDGQVFAAPVASYAPNRFGVYDLAGNVWEWTQDCYAPYERTPRDGSAYTNEDCARRSLRGGSWVYGLQDLRSAQRNGLPRPEQRGGDIGFRVARGL